MLPDTNATTADASSNQAAQAGNVPTDLQAMQSKLGAVLAQCPQLEQIPASALDAPIDVTYWGHRGPRVVLVHGGVQGDLGGGPSLFNGQQALGNRGWQVWRVARPGFARTPSRGVDDMDADAIWIAEMLEGGAHLIGHSWGGADALLAASLKPLAVRSLILVEPALETVVSPLSVESEAARLDKASRMRTMTNVATPADFGRAVGMSLNGDGTSASAQQITTRLADPKIAAATGCATLRAKQATAQHLKEAAATVTAAKIPVLVISGGWSAYTDATCEALACLLQGKHVIVKSSDHYVMAGDVASFNEVVDAFMREH